MGYADGVGQIRPAETVKEVFEMRHFYVRATLGAVFAVCLVFCLVTANLPFALLYLALSSLFLGSAYALWKKEKGRRKGPGGDDEP